jgi:hypothetical protein
MPTAAPVYPCQCTVCKSLRKSYTKRTIESHLRRDRNLLQSVPPSDTQLTSFVRLCIDQNIQLLSCIYRGQMPTDTASDAQGSHAEDFTGVQLKSLTS